MSNPGRYLDSRLLKHGALIYQVKVLYLTSIFQFTYPAGRHQIGYSQGGRTG
jgi:hypothetical protein